MENNIYIYKKGRLLVNPIWVSLNKGKYKLYFSNPIRLSTNQVENTIKLRDMFFIHSKKIDIQCTDTSTSFDIQITKLERCFGIGTIIVALFCLFYIMCPWRFIPTQVLFYILFGYLGVATILLFIFKRKNYFKVKYKL